MFGLRRINRDSIQEKLKSIVGNLGVFCKWSLIAILVGVAAGAFSTAFGHCINFVTTFRTNHLWAIFFLPFAGITVSSRESVSFRNGITKICATKVSAGVSTGIGDHEEKYEGKEDADVGDEQFEINDNRSFKTMYEDMEQGGLQPVLNDYIYV